jgi:signal transduction histidine kinase/ActR/RegA family two-component response regulator
MINTPQESAHEIGAMIEAMQTRRAQIKLRIGLSLCIATIFFMVVGLGFSLVWAVVYGLSQALEAWLFPLDQLSARLSKPEWRRRAVLVVVASNVVFSSYVMAEAFHNNVGLECAMFLIAGIIFNAILTSTRCPPLMWAGIGPAFLNLLVIPTAYYVHEKSALNTFFLSTTVVFYALAMLQGWTLIRSLLKTERLAREAAEQANAAKTRFVANTSHELRTPLNAVVASASLLARLDLSPRGRELVDLLIHGSNTLHALICDILDASKATAGRLELYNQPFAPVAVVGAAVEMFRAAAEAKGIDLVFEVDGENGWLLGDSLRLGQIVTNLCNNAVKFTVSGSICVRLALAAAGDERTSLHLSVADTGIGMDAATAAKIFDPFVQADVSTTRNYGGTGLGLSIAKALAEKMGGVLMVESEPGIGSTFHLAMQLPIAETPAEPAAPSDSEASDARAGERLRILVADDSVSNRRLIGFILEDIADLVLVENGREALDAIAANAFDLFICDIQMPIMDGPAALAQLRQSEQTDNRPHLPVIIATADAAMSLAQAQSLGANSVVTKPFTAQSLLEAVSNAYDAIGYDEAA